MNYWFVLLLCITAVYGQLGHQDRKVYYNDKDHICIHPSLDFVNVVISGIGGELRKFYDVDTISHCDTWAWSAVRSIIVLGGFSY